MRPIISILLFFIISNLQAQEVQWASELIGFSSQYGEKGFSAKQVLGKPNKFPSFGVSAVAWAPAEDSRRNTEYIQVAYSRPMQIRQVAVAETFQPGSVSRIYLVDTRGKQYLVYENKKTGPIFMPARWLRINFPLTEYQVQSVKVELEPKNMSRSAHIDPGDKNKYDLVQIDAIGISDSEEPIKSSINEIIFENYEEKADNLGPMVNSQVDDMLPIISPDGRTLYFCRKKHMQNFGEDKADDIWVSHRDNNGRWSPAVNIGEPLNNKYHNYVCAVSADANTLVLANKYSRLGIPAEGVSISHSTDKGWSFPRNLEIENFYNRNEFSNYHMSTNGHVLVMAIERDDTYGDMDLYVSFKKSDNTWTEPKNMGAQVNTAAAEGSVFLAADNRTIYFSSEGFSGYGDFDMFMSRRLDDTWENWTEPVNLGPKINSRLRDVYYTIPAAGDHVYFSSDQNSFGGADLYRIKLPREIQPLPVTLMKGKVIDALTNKPLDADIKYVPRDNKISTGETATSDGNFQIVMPREDKYTVVASVPGYFPESKTMHEDDPLQEEMLMDYDESDNIEPIRRDILAELKKEVIDRIPSRTGTPNAGHTEIEDKVEEKIQEKLKEHPTVELTNEEKEKLQRDLEETLKEQADQTNEHEEYQEIDEDIRLVPVKEGQIIRINNIYFTANKAHIRPESDGELDKVVQFLEENPNIYIEVRGHTNGLPSHEFCQELSNNRAEAVTKYLVKNGIDDRRIIYKGYGKTMPIADNSTLAGRKQNQRVEIKIMKIE